MSKRKTQRIKMGSPKPLAKKVQRKKAVENQQKNPSLMSSPSKLTDKAKWPASKRRTSL